MNLMLTIGQCKGLWIRFQKDEQYLAISYLCQYTNSNLINQQSCLLCNAPTNNWTNKESIPYKNFLPLLSQFLNLSLYVNLGSIL